MEQMSVDDHLSVVQVVGEWGCWKLPNKPTDRGYVQIWVGNRQPLAHRAVYEHLIKKIRPNLTLDHLCRHRWCIHPNHVDPVTRGENVLRGDGITARNKRKTRCPRGHQYATENTLLTREGFRQCRKCNRARFRIWLAAQPTSWVRARDRKK